VRGPKFYGRRAQIEEILEGNRSWLWLLGTRRVGKTSLLKQLEHVTSSSPESGYFPIFWDFQGAESPEELHQYFADALLDAEERLETLGVDLAELETDNLFSSMERLRRRLRSKNLALLLLCDEVEELIKLNERDPALLSKLRRAMQSREDVRSVLASSIRLWALAEQKGDTSPFLHGFTPPLYIEALSDEEARALIRQENLRPEARPQFEPKAVELIRSRCDNHPYLIQLVCKRFQETTDLEEALEQVATDATVHHFFSVDFEMLTEEERDVLRVIVKRTAASSDSIQESMLVETGSLRGSLHRLEHLGLIRRNQERRFFVVNDFFRRWLRNQQTPERLTAMSAAPGGPVPDSAQPGSVSSIGAELWSGSTGSMLLHYRILGDLGEGGMGEVYSAEDTKLVPNLALKVLPPEMAADPERLERFQREARTLAALNHPNIVTIYSVETAGGVRFITTELIEGKTLDEFVAPGLPLAATLELFLPLLGALGAAHAQGIIHRDLKPANIMVTGDNFVKLLDFGVAVFKGPPAATVDTQTDTKALTAPGRLLGTIPYMSPEQVKGERVDQRTDLFSLGVVLYEVLTGTRPFRGRTAAELLSAILRDKPPLVTAVRPDLPRGIARIVARCLEKDPAYRYASARDLRDEVDGVIGTLDLEPSSTPSALSRLLARFRRS
jgi:serine/threonine protein kinase